jgi:hypothetical protein
LYVTNYKSTSAAINHPEQTIAGTVDCVGIGQYLLNLVSM